MVKLPFWTVKIKIKQGLQSKIRNLVPKRNVTIRALIARFSVERMSVYGYTLDLLPGHAEIVRHELNIWERFYLPCPIRGKTILDVGGGCGETAAFFIHHGARKVIAIERDPSACKLLISNTIRNHMNIDIFCGAFSLNDLCIPHDFMKMDIEGGEELLIDYAGRIKPCVIEVHDYIKKGLSNALATRFDLNARRFNNNTVLLSSSDC